MACMVLRRPVVTGHLQIDFAAPIPLGSVLELRARIDGTVRRKVYTSAEARIVEGPFADPDVVVEDGVAGTIVQEGAGDDGGLVRIGAGEAH